MALRLIKGKKGMGWQQIAGLILLVLFLIAVLYWYGKDLAEALKGLFKGILDFIS